MLGVFSDTLLKILKVSICSVDLTAVKCVAFQETEPVKLRKRL